MIASSGRGYLGCQLYLLILFAGGWHWQWAWLPRLSVVSVRRWLTLAVGVATSAVSCICSQVVDIGSGRGYLGCQLALTHNLHVLGVDSSSSNSQSAASRTAKLGRQWEGLVRNAQRRADAKKGVSVDQSPKMDASRVLPHSTDSTGDVNAAAIVSGCATTAVKGNTRKLVSVSYVPVTCFITPEISLSDLLSSHCNWPLLAGDGFLLTGLHTCGELAPSTLQLFHTSSETTALCNVGCCYHLLEEAFLRSPYANQGTLHGNETIMVWKWNKTIIVYNEHYLLYCGVILYNA